MNCRFCNQTHTDKKYALRCKNGWLKTQKELKQALSTQTGEDNELLQLYRKQKDDQAKIQQQKEQIDELFLKNMSQSVYIEQLEKCLMVTRGKIQHQEMEIKSRSEQLKNRQKQITEQIQLNTSIERYRNNFFCQKLKSTLNLIRIDGQILDMDSFAAFVSPKSLRYICAWKSTLGATKFKPFGDKQSKKMCLLLSSFPSVYVDQEFIFAIRSELRKNGVIFSDASSSLCTAAKQVNIQTQKMIAILEKLNIYRVRIVQHGLKAKQFWSFLENVELKDDRNNRIDFGVTVYHSAIRMFMKKDQTDKSSKIWSLLTHPLAGGVTLTRKNNQFKAYSNVAHYLKHYLNFKEPMSGIKLCSIRSSIGNIKTFIGELNMNPPDFGTRYQVSVFSFEDHLEQAQLDLLWFMEYLKNEFIIIEVDSQMYIKNIQNLLEYFDTKEEWKGSANQIASQNQLKNYAFLLAMLGWSSRFVTRIISRCKRMPPIDPETFKYPRNFKTNDEVPRQTRIFRNRLGRFI